MLPVKNTELVASQVTESDVMLSTIHPSKDGSAALPGLAPVIPLANSVIVSPLDTASPIGGKSKK
jgi:hypothetical protein